MKKTVLLFVLHLTQLEWAELLGTQVITNGKSTSIVWNINAVGLGDKRKHLFISPIIFLIGNSSSDKGFVSLLFVQLDSFLICLIFYKQTVKIRLISLDI